MLLYLQLQIPYYPMALVSVPASLWKFLLTFDLQCTNTKFWCCRTSTHHTSFFTMYVFVCLNRYYKLSPMDLTDGHSKVTTMSVEIMVRCIKHISLSAIKAYAVVFIRLLLW